MSEDIKTRFLNEIKLRAYDDRYVDQAEEKEILRVAINVGVDIDTARMALAQVCESANYLLESAILKDAKFQLEACMGNDGKIEESEFNLVFNTVKNKIQGKKNDRSIKKLLVGLMEEHGLNKVKSGWFSNWYTELKKEVGLG
jgi:hypothetical protein